MRLPFGLELTRRKSVSSVDGRGWHRWFGWVGEPFAGAWQRNREQRLDEVTAHHAVFACVTLIASDMGKLWPELVRFDPASNIWVPTESPAFSPVLRKPNHYQNHIQFKEWWATSKLLHGNAYALKVRDNRGGPDREKGTVVRLHLLDPTRVKVLVSEDGSVFYQLSTDNLANIGQQGIAVPASEIIHDRINCLFHPLCGLSPIYAAAYQAAIGLDIETSQESFFRKGSNPSGVLSGPQEINEATAKRLAEQWNALYSGENSGKVAVMGNDLKFTPLRMSAADSQLIEQLKWSAQTVCSAFRVPPFKVGIGQMPTYQNGETLNQIYYSDCLQSHIEQFEAAMDEGLGIGVGSPKGENRTIYGVRLDLDGLFRMDSQTQIKTLKEGVTGGLYAPNEARQKLDLAPKPGGDSPYLQQQNYSLEALAKRDAQDDPFARSRTINNGAAPPAPSAEPAEQERAAELAALIKARALAYEPDTEMAA